MGGRPSDGRGLEGSLMGRPLGRGGLRPQGRDSGGGTWHGEGARGRRLLAPGGGGARLGAALRAWGGGCPRVRGGLVRGRRGVGLSVRACHPAG